MLIIGFMRNTEDFTIKTENSSSKFGKIFILPNFLCILPIDRPILLCYNTIEQF